MNKYAELQKIAVLYAACRGILRVKLAARFRYTYQQMNAWTPEQVKQYYDQYYSDPSLNAKRKAWFDERMKQQDYLDYVKGTSGGGSAPVNTANGTTGGVAPTQPQQQQNRTWGQYFQDMLDWGEDQMRANGALVTRGQQQVADKINADNAIAAQEGIANGEYNGYDPATQQVRASGVSQETVVKDPNAQANTASNNNGGGGGNNITINNNMPEGYGGGGGGQGGSDGYGGESQQYSSGPGLADYINQYSSNRRATA